MWDYLGIAGIFFSLAVENFGVPFPTEAAYVAACALLDQGRSYLFIFTVLTAGHLVGSSAAYFAGREMRAWTYRRLGQKRELQQMADKLQLWYARYGLLAVFLFRFVGYARPWSSLVAGFARLRPVGFFLATFLGTVIFNLVLLEVTRRFLTLLSPSEGVRLALAGMIITSLMFFFAVRYYRTRRKKTS
ncbi:DedA family protein [Desulforudis sp. DRI-14]|uniref:DedA family protein n=1 Tax=Desulforudis sp. DRI-14 TaxID=3459793 RepID=UPI0040429E25